MLKALVRKLVLVVGALSLLATVVTPLALAGVVIDISASKESLVENLEARDRGALNVRIQEAECLPHQGWCVSDSKG